MFEVKYSNNAERFLKKAEKQIVKRILKKIEKLREEPFPSKVKRVKGVEEKLFRVRVGDYRILYEIDNDNNLIGIVNIDKRETIY